MFSYLAGKFHSAFSDCKTMPLHRLVVITLIIMSSWPVRALNAAVFSITHVPAYVKLTCKFTNTEAPSLVNETPNLVNMRTRKRQWWIGHRVRLQHESLVQGKQPAERGRTMMADGGEQEWRYVRENEEYRETWRNIRHEQSVFSRLSSIGGGMQ